MNVKGENMSEDTGIFLLLQNKENTTTVRPWDARFWGNEKTSASQKRVT